jgi:hypothetical protein
MALIFLPILVIYHGFERAPWSSAKPIQPIVSANLHPNPRFNLVRGMQNHLFSSG